MAGNVPETASTADLNAHKAESWRDAHHIWADVKAYIDARTLVQITAVDITSLFTWDGGQHTLDLTANTSATARWAIISYYVAGIGGDVMDPLVFRTVGGATNIIQIIGDKHFIDTADGSIFAPRFGAGGLWIPLDSNHKVDYIAPAWDTKQIFLLGYSG